jgi:hypothetical protein
MWGFLQGKLQIGLAEVLIDFLFALPREFEFIPENRAAQMAMVLLIILEKMREVQCQYNKEV